MNTALLSFVRDAQLRTSNGSWRTTHRGRLKTFDETLVKLLPNRERPYLVVDVGVSSGITTLDLIDALEKAGHALKVVALDRVTGCSFVKLFPGAYALAEDSGHFLGALVFGVPVRETTSGSRLDYLTGKALIKKLVAASFHWRVQRQKDRKPVPLIVSELARRSNVEIKKLDILTQPLPEGVDVVRLANVVQRTYFSERDIARIAASVLHSCSAGAIIVLAHDSPNGELQGSFLRIADGSCAVVARIGRGSEVENFFTGRIR